MLNMNNNMMGNMNLNMNMGINPMGMNNQLLPNLAMDNSAARIKAIIEPYEKKITELEKIIKQKDFEIILLKEKLNGFTNNQMLMNIQNNMNIMNPMLMNNNGNFINNFNFNMANNNNMNLNLLNNYNNMPLQDWIIIFNYKDKSYTEQCNKGETVEVVSKRFCEKIGIKFTAHKFIHNSLPLVKEVKLIENGLFNGSKILVIEKERVKCDDDTFYYYTDKECEEDCLCEGSKYNIIFKHSNGMKITIYLGKEHSIGALIKRFLRRNPIQDLNFINLGHTFCAVNHLLNWKIDEKKKLKDIFGIQVNQTVNVTDINNLC